MCVEQQLAIIVTGRGKMDDQDDRPFASGSASETHPRSTLFKSHPPLRLHEAYGKCKQTMEQRQLLGAPYRDGLQVETAEMC